MGRTARRVEDILYVTVLYVTVLYMSTRRKHISLARKKRQRGGNPNHHDVAKIISTHYALKSAAQGSDVVKGIQEGVEQGEEIVDKVDKGKEIVGQVVGQVLDKKADALKRQGNNAAAQSLNASKEIAKAEVQTTLDVIVHNEIGFVENMGVATVAEGVSELPGVGPIIGEALEGIYNQGKAVYKAKTEFDKKMEVIRNKEAELQAKKDALLKLNPEDVDAKKALQEEIRKHKKKIRKHKAKLSKLDKQVKEEVEKFIELASKSHIKLANILHQMNKLVENAHNENVTNKWEKALKSLDEVLQKKTNIEKFKANLEGVNGLQDNQKEFDKLTGEIINTLSQAAEEENKVAKKGGSTTRKYVRKRKTKEKTKRKTKRKNKKKNKKKNEAQSTKTL